MWCWRLWVVLFYLGLFICGKVLFVCFCIPFQEPRAPYMAHNLSSIMEHIVWGKTEKERAEGRVWGPSPPLFFLICGSLRLGFCPQKDPGEFHLRALQPFLSLWWICQVCHSWATMFCKVYLLWSGCGHCSLLRSQDGIGQMQHKVLIVPSSRAAWWLSIAWVFFWWAIFLLGLCQWDAQYPLQHLSELVHSSNVTRKKLILGRS